jgi:tRNA A-37 threonylcarbamoyl transferase component Bud32/tetratricopeptide (TPR) repeat protein
MPGQNGDPADKAGIDRTTFVPPPSLIARLNDGLAGRYEIGEELGRGGAAYVFRAHDLHRQQDVALKVLRPELTAAVTEIRFLREIDTIAKLEHPNVVQLLDSGSVGGQVYYTMPFVASQTLRHRLQRSAPLPIAEVIRIARDIASALDYAHSCGVVHRDVKPSNTLLTDTHALVTDFGIARAIVVASGEQLTDTGMSIGTPEYMSPEQGMGARQIDGHADIYSLGCVVYEMLSGAPPFTGPTPQAIIARHCHEPPPPLRVVRPGVSRALASVVERALAKVPADRFATAGEFVHAMEAAAKVPDNPAWRRLATRRNALAGALVVIVAVWGLAFLKRSDLDLNQIVVFPLTMTERLKSGEPSGEEVATLIGWALEETQPLRWHEGWELLDPKARDAPRLTTATARDLSRRARAGYFIDGAIIFGADSVTVVLRLYSVGRDSMVTTKRVTDRRGASLLDLGLRAVALLMPALLQPGHDIDLSALADRKPAAAVNFVLGEHEYRRMQFRPALDHYKAAVRLDSVFALAALRGAEAADWLSRFDEDSALVQIALANEQTLPPAYRPIARGLHAYLIGSADSAVHYFERALALRPTSQVWTLLGEVYARMLPSRGPADSLSELAFRQARELDSDFAPALVHLERLAQRRGDLAGSARFAAELKAASADTSHAFSRSLMARCLAEGPAAIDSKAARQDAESVFGVGKLFSAGASQRQCARAALEAILDSDSLVPRGYRRASLMMLDGLDAASGHIGVIANTSRRGTTDLPRWRLYSLRATTGLGSEKEIRSALDSLAPSYRALPTGDLWYAAIGAWALRDARTLLLIQREAVARADSSRTRLDRQVASLISPHVRLLRGDSTGAIGELRELRPNARRNDITYQPWESLAHERLLLAELLLTRGDARKAIDLATLIDAPEPVVHLYYLRPSLQLRVRAAERLGNARLARDYRMRLSRLDLGSTPGARGNVTP